jgi:putative phosphoesterase
MKIAVLADTHLSSFNEMPGWIVDALSHVDLIVHCGDFVTSDVLEGLKRIKDVKAVYGNMDSNELKLTLPEKELFSSGGKQIGLIHGWGAPFGIEGRVKRMFNKPDVIIYGHSHAPQNKVIGGILFFNPGRCHNSYGLLTIDYGIEAKIVNLK